MYVYTDDLFGVCSQPVGLCAGDPSTWCLPSTVIYSALSFLLSPFITVPLFHLVSLLDSVSKMTKYQSQLIQGQILFLMILSLFKHPGASDSFNFSQVNSTPVPASNITLKENLKILEPFPNPNKGCPDSSCSSAGYCYCDHSCLLYGDCCHDANVTTEIAAQDQQFSCVQSGAATYWMITSCSHSWITDQLADGVANVNDIASLCEDSTITRASYKIVPPPVTDGSTGLVYRNEFCARCNGLQQSNEVPWSIQLDCQDIIIISLNGVSVQRNFTLDELLELCYVKHYHPPSSLSNPRGCKRLPTGLIPTCPEDSPMDLRENCTKFGLNLVTYAWWICVC